MTQAFSTVRKDLPHLVTPLPGPQARAIIARDHTVLSPSYTRPYPLVVKKGEGAIVEDVDGNRFLDLNAGIAVVATGHCHPKVVEAIQRQAAQLIHMSGTDFYYENMVQLAEKLAQLAPGKLPRKVYFGNSGTEAIEAALKMARYHTGREKFVAFLGGFHGRTLGALSLTASKAVQRKGFGTLLPGIVHVPYANCYRCAYNRQPETCKVECVKFIEHEVLRCMLPAEEVAAIILEPIQGEGGYIVPPQKFFDELQALAQRHGIRLIVDEVQSGMGRTGKMWASDHFGLEPDILTVAKGIASGLPLSATIARVELMQWKPGAHASTFGGNPVAVAAALATVELLEQELIDNAARVGQHMLNRLSEWPQRYRYVGDVRGRGLMIGIEFVRDQQSRERFPEFRDQLETLAFERGVLVLGAGPNSIRLSPPLTLTRDQADFAIDTLEDCVKTLTMNT
ncbi:MAG: acetyl ornithine aminotransferase family protein [Bryobacteraceae bacterium]|nr:acetyl ornithine aminotransferase family protein [Bryobacteraceae bacterium]MDW8379112.1 acetyl ornithine aminotransferase family protein [Bryobacterales bacterium]